MLLALRVLCATSLLSGVALAVPRPDSGINEPAFSAPDGLLLSDTLTQKTQTGGAPGTGTAGSGYPATTTNYGNPQGGYVTPSPDNKETNSPAGYTPNSPEATTKKEQEMTTKQGQQTATDTAPGSYSTPTYGSGSKWGGSPNPGYDDCVNKCMKMYGPPSTPDKPPPGTPTTPDNGNKTVPVIVAPTQGVLRFVPFAVQAPPGSTVKFMWGANMHTVTKSSALLPCNKSADKLFTSGTQNKGFVFEQVVNDTSPTFFYCGVPTHCQKGMFGILNPNNASGSPSSYGNMEKSIMDKNPDLGTYSTMTKKNCANDPGAAQWGANMDMSALPDWSHSYVSENILYTRNFLAANPGILKENGFIDVTSSASLMIPPDMSVALKSSSPTSSSGSASPSASSGSNPTSGSQQQEAGALKSGAVTITPPRALAGFIVAVASFFIL